jgi:hypothetical protein
MLRSCAAPRHASTLASLLTTRAVNPEPERMLARFLVDGEERETRDVSEAWLDDASTTHENVLLRDGNTYCVANVTYVGSGPGKHARVELHAPQFARGS